MLNLLRFRDVADYTANPELRYRASDCSDRRFTPSAYCRTPDTELIGGEHDYEYSESQRR